MHGYSAKRVIENVWARNIGGIGENNIQSMLQAFYNFSFIFILIIIKWY